MLLFSRSNIVFFLFVLFLKNINLFLLSTTKLQNPHQGPTWTAEDHLTRIQVSISSSQGGSPPGGCHECHVAGGINNLPVGVVPHRDVLVPVVSYHSQLLLCFNFHITFSNKLNHFSDANRNFSFKFSYFEIKITHFLNI